jgi:ApaG protein
MAESKKYQIEARALPQFVADQSDPANERYIFAYTITFENVGTVAAQVISRHWIITDANARVQEVRGLGVVGQQPLLQPGETFEYTSGCQLDTPVGTMSGKFQVTGEDGTQFEAVVEEFTLSIPRVLH